MDGYNVYAVWMDTLDTGGIIDEMNGRVDEWKGGRMDGYMD